MRHRGEREASTRKGFRGAVLVTTAVIAMLIGPSLAVAITPPPAPKPVNTAAPVLTGTPAVGSTLSCSQGSWTNSPTSYSYAWLRDGSPIAGQTGSTYVVQSADQGNGIACRVTADNATGEYTISGLPSGSYKVGFFAYGEGDNYLPQYYNGKAKVAEANSVPVAAPGTTGGIDAELAPGGNITGRVIDAITHAPVANVDVCAEEASPEYFFGECVHTGANGEYTISGLSSGSYKVSFYAGEIVGSNYAPQYYNGKSMYSESTPVGVTAGSTTSNINAELHTGGRISGKVTKAGSVPLAGIAVCAEGEFYFECATTNASGEYTISGLPSGSYVVEFSPESSADNYETEYYNGVLKYEEAAAVNVSAGETKKEINAEMHPGGQITGKVTKPGGAAFPDIEVCAYLISTGRSDGCSSTASTGEYTISSLTSGEYAVQFFGSGSYAAQYYNNRLHFSEATNVEVIAETITSKINAELHLGGQITGKVTSASTHAGLAKIEVCSIEISSEHRYDCTSTGTEGSYTIEGLREGSYRIEFYPGFEAGNYVTQYYNGKASAAEATPVPVQEEHTVANINAEMQAGGQITGKVLDASTHTGLLNIEVCAEEIGGSSGGCAATKNSGGGRVSATSNVLSVPAPNSSFTLAKAPSFDAKTDDVLFFFKVSNAGKFRWNLSFRNSDVGFSAALSSSFDGLVLAEASKKKSKGKKCKKGEIKHHGKCVRSTVPFGSGSQEVGTGTVEIKVHASSKAIKGLKAGHTLHVSGPFTFQSALGGSPVTHTESATVRMPKKKKGKKHGKK